MSYLRQLENLDPAASLLVPTRRRLLLLTGQSAWTSAALTTDQRVFLTAIAGDDALLAGFPYHQHCIGTANPSLARGSIRNIRQASWCLLSQTYRTILRQVLHRAITSTEERLLILCGSCGLEMLNAADVTLSPQTRVAAIGPTCLAAVRTRVDYVVQGRSDRISQALYRGRVDLRLPGGHFSYYNSLEAQQYLREAWHQ
jgi:hypothetical protein